MRFWLPDSPSWVPSFPPGAKRALGGPGRECRGTASLALQKVPSSPGNPVLRPPLPAPEFIPGLTAPLPSPPEAQSCSPNAVDGSLLALQTRVPCAPARAAPPGLRVLHLAAPHWPLRPRPVAGYLGVTPAPSNSAFAPEHRRPPVFLSPLPKTQPCSSNCSSKGGLGTTAAPRVNNQSANQHRRSVQRAERAARQPLYRVKPRPPRPRQQTNRQ